MKPFTLFLSLLTLLSLAGCAALPPTGPKLVKQLVLLHSVPVRESYTRTFIQDGEVVKRIDEFRPHCALEIRQLHSPPRTIPAGVYPVTRVQGAATPVVLISPGRRYAALAARFALGVGDSDGSPSDIFEGYHFWLADSANVGLMRLTCYGARDTPGDAKPPSLAEINKALGGIGRLETGGQQD